MPETKKLDLRKRSKISWEKVFREIKRAAVYIDDSCLESLHWLYDFDILFESGAVEVKRFISSESTKKENQKAVFLLSSLLHGDTLEVLHNIIECSNFRFVSIISGLPPAINTVHKYGIGETEDKRWFRELELIICEWTGDMNNTVEILHIPYVFVTLSPELIVLSQHHNFKALLFHEQNDLVKLHKTPKKDIQLIDLDFIHLNRQSQLKYKVLVTSIDCVLDQLMICEDLFSIGTSSKIIAAELAALSSAKQRRKNSEYFKASMLIIDRTIDFSNVIGHHQDNLMDFCLNVLKTLNGHKIDVSADMSNLCGLHSSCIHTIAPGCLSQPNSTISQNLLKQMSYLKFKEALTHVQRQLIEIASKENLLVKPPKSSKLGAEEILAILNLFRLKLENKNLDTGVIQIGQIIVNALNSVNNRQKLFAAEKGLLLAENFLTALKQVYESLKVDLKKSVEERAHDSDDYLSLFVFVFSLYDCSNYDYKELERDIKTVFIDFIKNISPVEMKFLTKCLIIDKVTSRIDQFAVLTDFFFNLKSVSSCKSLYKLHNKHDNIESFTNRSCVLKQIANMIVDPNKPELSDAVHHATGFKQFLKSGFGFLTGGIKPRPGDQPILIMCVLGGVTIEEVKCIVEVFQSSNIQVIVMTNRIVKTESFISDLFLNRS